MATNKNITMKQFNGVDYDTLYPKTIASQVDDVYSKSEVDAAIAAITPAKIVFGTIYYDSSTPSTLGSQTIVTKISRELFDKFRMIICRCYGDGGNRRGYSVLMAKESDFKWGAELVTTVPIQNMVAGRYVTVESTSETEVTITINNGHLGTNNSANNVAILVEITAVYLE